MSFITFCYLAWMISPQYYSYLLGDVTLSSPASGLTGPTKLLACSYSPYKVSYYGAKWRFPLLLLSDDVKEGSCQFSTSPPGESSMTDQGRALEKLEDEKRRDGCGGLWLYDPFQRSQYSLHLQSYLKPVSLLLSECLTTPPSEPNLGPVQSVWLLLRLRRV